MRAIKPLVFITCLTLFSISGYCDEPLYSQTREVEAAVGQTGERSKFPALPPGYSWITHKGVAIPKPDHWNEYQTREIYVTSIESVKEQGIFETGATIQVIQDVQKNYNAPASIGAINYVKDIKENTDNQLLLFDHNETGDFKTFIIRYKNDPVAAKPVIVHKFIMANDKESFINIVTFESPEVTWSEYWEKTGITIFGRILSVKYAGNQ